MKSRTAIGLLGLCAFISVAQAAPESCRKKQKPAEIAVCLADRLEELERDTVPTQRCRLVEGEPSKNPNLGMGSIATCPTGEFITGGACKSSSNANVAAISRMFSKPAGHALPNSYECNRATKGDKDDEFIAQAICCK